MSLEQASLLSQIVAAIALVISFVFVGLQIRQNTRSQRVVAVDSLATAIAAINVPAMESPNLGDALSVVFRNWEAGTREQRIMAHFFLLSFFKLSESAWYQRRSEVLDEQQWIGWETLLRAIYHAEGVKNGWWPSRKNAYSPQFQTHLACCKNPGAEMVDLYAHFGNGVGD